MTSKYPSLVNGLTLFTHYVCPYAHRTTLALLEHGSPLNNIVNVVTPGLGSTMQSWYIKQLNPNETVPALLIHNSPSVKAKQIHELSVPQDGTIVLESLDICKFFDKFVNEPENAEQEQALVSFADGEKLFNKRIRLYPSAVAAAEEKKSIDDFISHIDDHLIPQCYKLLMISPEKQVKKASQVADMMAEAEQLVIRSQQQQQNGGNDEAAGGPYFLGRRFSLADVAIVPFLDRFSHTLPLYVTKTAAEASSGGGAFDLFAKAPRMKRMLEAASMRRSFRATAMPAEYYVKRYKYYTFEHSQGQDPRDR